MSWEKENGGGDAEKSDRPAEAKIIEGGQEMASALCPASQAGEA
jgi:hypothetical protein